MHDGRSLQVGLTILGRHRDPSPGRHHDKSALVCELGGTILIVL